MYTLVPGLLVKTPNNGEGGGGNTNNGGGYLRSFLNRTKTLQLNQPYFDIARTIEINIAAGVQQEFH
jgi:hypothetical protein